MSMQAKGGGGYASQGQQAIAKLIRGMRKTDEAAEPPPVAFYERGPDRAVMVRVSPNGDGEAFEGQKPTIESLGGDDVYEEVDMRGVFVIRLRHGRGVAKGAGTKSIYAGRWWCGKKSGRGVELDACGMYSGAFKMDTRWGLGTLRNAHGDTYTGRFGPSRHGLTRYARQRKRVEDSVVGTPSDPAEFDAPIDDGEARGEIDGPERSVGGADAEGGYPGSAGGKGAKPDAGAAGSRGAAGEVPPLGRPSVLQHASQAQAIASSDPDALRIRAGLAALEHHVGGRAGAVVRNADVASARNKYFQYGMPDDDSGNARIVFADGSVYAGEMRDGRIEGKGRYESAQGAVFEGHFKDGMLEGKGTHISQHGVVSEGEWRMGQLHGRAVRTGGGMYGDMYAGRFHRGLATGRGRWLTRGGQTVYDGFFQLGMKTGRGCLHALTQDAAGGRLSATGIAVAAVKGEGADDDVGADEEEDGGAAAEGAGAPGGGGGGGGSGNGTAKKALPTNALRRGGSEAIARRAAQAAAIEKRKRDERRKKKTISTAFNKGSKAEYGQDIFGQFDAVTVSGRWRASRLQPRGQVAFVPHSAVNLHAERPPSLPTSGLEKAVFGEQYHELVCPGVVKAATSSHGGGGGKRAGSGAGGVGAGGGKEDDEEA